jgi:hypothetical protein
VTITFSFSKKRNALQKGSNANDCDELTHAKNEFARQDGKLRRAIKIPFAKITVAKED